MLVLKKLLFSHVSWFSGSSQSSMGHSINTTLGDFLSCHMSIKSVCFLVRRENKLALFEFGCVFCRLMSCISLHSWLIFAVSDAVEEVGGAEGRRAR